MQRLSFETAAVVIYTEKPEVICIISGFQRED